MSHDFKRDGNRTVARARRGRFYGWVSESASYHVLGNVHYGVEATHWGSGGREVTIWLGRFAVVVGRGGE